MERGPVNPMLGRPEQRPPLTRDVRSLLVVVAHPDDESFGLGALLDRFTACGIPVAVLCFTHGEASTLHSAPGELAAVRARELRVAAQVLGVDPVELLDYPDGRLADMPAAELAAQVTRLIGELEPSHLLVFDEYGVTGHPDHMAATRAALDAAREAGRTVLAWALPEPVTARLNAQFGTSFVGRAPEQLDARLSVSRTRQRRAIAAHASQSTNNPVLHRRLALQADTEHLRLLHQPNLGGNMSYGYTIHIAEPLSAGLVDRVREALRGQGFGVLTEIDIQQTLRDKLGEELEPYLILGACNPPLARDALRIDRQIGLLLPCNVVVRADGPDATVVEALDPQTIVQVAGRPELKATADEAATRLRTALDSLTGAAEQPDGTGTPDS